MVSFFRFLGFAALYFWALSTTASAFPPAPGVLFFGTGRDAFGNTIDHTAGAILEVSSDGVLIAQTPIDERLKVFENYRVQVPLDLDAVDPYTESALALGEVISFAVRFPSGVVPVTGISVAERQLNEPASLIRVDFSLGSDADGDGLPDDWELTQLEEAGILSDDARFSLSTLDRDGDFDGDGVSNYSEYIAGTFALIQRSVLRLQAIGLLEDGFARLQTTLTFGKTYRLDTSRDLVTWTPVTFCLEGRRDQAALEFTANDDGLTILEASPAGAEEESRPRFFRLGVR